MPISTTAEIAKQIEIRILMLRGQRVILDADLSALYGVTTIRNLITAIHQLMEPPPSAKKLPIGFAPWSEEIGKCTNE